MIRGLPSNNLNVPADKHQLRLTFLVHRAPYALTGMLILFVFNTSTSLSVIVRAVDNLPCAFLTILPKMLYR